MATTAGLYNPGLCVTAAEVAVSNVENAMGVLSLVELTLCDDHSRIDWCLESVAGAQVLLRQAVQVLAPAARELAVLKERLAKEDADEAAS